MPTAKQVINSIKPNLSNPPVGITQKGSAGYDNVRDDIEKTKHLREGSIQKVPVNGDDIVNKDYVDNTSIGSEITLYLSDTVSDIATYFDLKPSPTGEAESSVGVVAGTGTLIKSFASILNCPCVSAIALLVPGAYESHIHAESTKTGCQIYAELYKRDNGGTETLLSTSETTDNLSVGSSSSYVIHFTILEDIAWTATDRVVVKYYANTGIGANPTVTMYMEGDTASRVTLKTTSFNRLHSSLGNLDYASAGHTGFAESLGADDNYVTDAELLVLQATSGTNTGDQNSHDSLDDVSSDDHHVEWTSTEHTAVGNGAPHHAESHNIASHSDTTATGTELNTLTDNSMADTLHRHSELSASDGTPDQALVVDASGKVGIGTAPSAQLHVAAPVATFRLTDTDDNSDCQIQGAAAGTLVFSADVNNEVAGSSILFRVDNSATKMSITSDGYVNFPTSKSTTGDPTGAQGKLYINSTDNVIKMYADGAWRTLASW